MFNNVIHNRFTNKIIITIVLALLIFASYQIPFLLFLISTIVIILVWFFALFYFRNAIVVNNSHLLVKNQFSNLNSVKVSYSELSRIHIYFSGEFSRYKMDDYVTLYLKSGNSYKVSFIANDINFDALKYLKNRATSHGLEVEITGQSLFLKKYINEINKGDKIQY